MRTNIKPSILLPTVALLIVTIPLLAQTDSLVFTNGKSAVGEIKKMERGVITMSTDYSSSDFKIEWDKVQEIYSQQSFLISLSDRTRITSTILFDVDDNRVVLTDEDEKVAVNVYDIVYFNLVERTFKDRFSANIDVGFNLTRANNLSQFNTRTRMGYHTEKWELGGSYNTVFSQQDSIGSTFRMDANVTVKRFLPHDYYFAVSNDFLSNDEQELKLRSNLKVGVGNYLVRTNVLYWGLFGGLAYNNESFTTESNASQETAEAFLGTEVNLFNAGDFGLSSSVIMYPNLTTKGRLRSDIKFDMVYDLPFDFYIKIGTTLNYDNQAASGAPLDYVIQSGLGWKW